MGDWPATKPLSEANLSELQNTIDQANTNVTNAKQALYNSIENKNSTPSSTAFDDLVDAIYNIVLGSGNAQPEDVKISKTFTNDTGVEQQGAMIDRGAVVITPGLTNQNISEGYHDGNGYVEAVERFFGNSSDGVFNSTGNVTISNASDSDFVVKQYSSFTLNTSHTLKTESSCKGLVIYVDGDCAINGDIDMSDKGLTTSLTTHTLIDSSLRIQDSVDNKFGLIISDKCGEGGSGGRGGYGEVDDQFPENGNQGSKQLYGGGMGGIGGRGSYNGASGGTAPDIRAGIFVLIVKGNITITGNIKSIGVNGNNGNDSTDLNYGSGGGSGGNGGGTIIILYQGTLTNSGTIDVSGGVKGIGGSTYGSNHCAQAGSGHNGREGTIIIKQIDN